MTSLTVEIPDGTDKSANVLRVDMYPRTIISGCGSFIILFNNQDGSLTGDFNVQDTVDIKVNTVDFMKGYVDTVTHVVYDRESYWTHMIKVTGRDYSQDLQNLIHTESYKYDTRIDDLIDDALDDTGSEITYASGSSESQIAGGFEAKNDYLMNIFRDVMERESYDGYVNSAKAFQLIDLSSPPASGIALKSISGDTGNNILATQPIEYTVEDGLAIKNSIKLIGQRVRNGWSEGNASDWTGGTNTTVTDETTNKKVGAASIKATHTFDAGNPLELYLDFSGGLYSKTANYLDWSIYGQEEIMWWFRGHRNAGAFRLYNRPLLTDTTGNVIDYYHAAWEIAVITQDVWYWLGAPVGVECVITGGVTNDRWHWVTNVDGNFTWKIEKLGWWAVGAGTAGSFQDITYLDDIRLPEEMVSITEDGTSIAAYRKRMVPIRKPYFNTQLELDDHAAAVKAVLKDKFEYLKLNADGATGIIGGADKWIPGNSLNVEITRFSLNKLFRMVTIHHIIEPRTNLDGQGHDFITELEMVPETSKVIGALFDALTKTSLAANIGRLEERTRSIEKQRSRSHLDVNTRGIEAK